MTNLNVFLVHFTKYIVMGVALSFLLAWGEGGITTPWLLTFAVWIFVGFYWYVITPWIDHAGFESYVKVVESADLEEIFGEYEDKIDHARFMASGWRRYAEKQDAIRSLISEGDTTEGFWEEIDRDVTKGTT